MYICIIFKKNFHGFRFLLPPLFPQMYSGLKVALWGSLVVLCIISSNAFLRPPQRIAVRRTYYHKTSVLPQSSHIVLRATPEEQKPEEAPKKKAAPPTSGLSEGMREKLLK